MRRLRLVVVLLVLAPLAGCMGAPEGPRLAQPTDEAPTVPIRGNLTPPVSTRPDYADGGYGLPDPWSAGDAWEWESPTRWRSLKVLDAATRNGSVVLRVLHSNGTLGPGPVSRVLWEVETTNWTRLSQKGVENARDLAFDPAAGGLRAFRNATHGYYENSSTGSTAVATLLHYKGPAVAPVAWGEVQAGRVDESTRRVGERNESVRIVRFVSHEYGHDVAFEVEGETFRLVAVDYAGVQRGVFRDD